MNKRWVSTILFFVILSFLFCSCTKDTSLLPTDSVVVSPNTKIVKKTPSSLPSDKITTDSPSKNEDHKEENSIVGLWVLHDDLTTQEENFMLDFSNNDIFVGLHSKNNQDFYLVGPTKYEVVSENSIILTPINSKQTETEVLSFKLKSNRTATVTFDNTTVELHRLQPIENLDKKILGFWIFDDQLEGNSILFSSNGHVYQGNIDWQYQVLGGNSFITLEPWEGSTDYNYNIVKSVSGSEMTLLRFGYQIKLAKQEVNERQDTAELLLGFWKTSDDSFNVEFLKDGRLIEEGDDIYDYELISPSLLIWGDITEPFIIKEITHNSLKLLSFRSPDEIWEFHK